MLRLIASEYSTHIRGNVRVYQSEAGDYKVDWRLSHGGSGFRVYIGVPKRQLSKALYDRLPKDDEIETSDQNLMITVPLSLPLRGGAKRIEGWDKPDWSVTKPRHDHALIKALSRAHEWREWIERGEISNIEGLAKHAGQE